MNEPLHHIRVKPSLYGDPTEIVRWRDPEECRIIEVILMQDLVDPPVGHMVVTYGLGDKNMKSHTETITTVHIHETPVREAVIAELPEERLVIAIHANWDLRLYVYNGIGGLVEALTYGRCVGNISVKAADYGFAVYRDTQNGPVKSMFRYDGTAII